ncbi:MAG: DUF559 domain-containing protein [Afipia sp.]|nr:MAG: DUF559 domain-containing protein [Afipia sp.]
MRGPNRKSTLRARRLRIDQTDAETKLWHRLRNRQIAHCKFVRQEPIGRYVCDFVCREHALIVEVDGGQHSESRYDEIRDRSLADDGYRILRFWNTDVLGNIEGVIETIHSALSDQLPLTPTLSP